MEQPYSLTVTDNYAIPSWVKNINVNTTTGAITVTLPDMATFFEWNIKSSQQVFEIWIYDYAGTAGTHNITINAAANDFFFSPDAGIVVNSLTLDVNYSGLKLVAQGGVNSVNRGGKWGTIAIS